jgi:glycosidase
MASRICALVAGVALALAGASAGCDKTPVDYDYHGGAVDVGDAEAWTVGDNRVVPPVDVNGQTDVADTTPPPDDVEPADDRGTATDFAKDEKVVVQRVRECTTTLSVKSPDGSPVFVAGEFSDWQTGQLPMEDADGDGTWTLQLDMKPYAPGSYGYKFHTQSDQWFMDPANPMSKWVGGLENSKLVVPDCKLPELKLKDSKADAAAGTLTVTVEVYNPAASAGVLPSTARVLVNGKETDPGFDGQDAVFHVKLTGLADGTKAALRLSVENEFGPSPELYLPFWVESTPWTWKDATMYFTFTDRFLNGDKSNDGKAACASMDIINWNGGDFQGIIDKIEGGYFSDLGVDVLWIAPVVDNPDGCFGDAAVQGYSFTAYHGYFPLNLADCENHFGDMDKLRELVNVAHEHGMRVLMDLVANHVAEESDVYKQHKDDGWFSSFYPCKPNWDKPIECWFEAYLPDLDYTNDAVVESMMANAVWWVLETGVDGFRVDAVKHMVHNFARSLRWHIRQRVETTDVPFYMVGETFMGEWGGGTGDAEKVIKEYVNGWELNGQFNFPYYWKVLRAAARDEGDFAELAAFLDASLSYWGPDALMVSFVGNHDVPRILSHAAGQITDMWGNGSKMQGLTAPPQAPGDADPFDRAKLALGLTLALPEIPMIYYGDEVGLPGAGDPDNRRNMQWEGLSGNQQAVLDFVKKAGSARRARPELRRGSYKTLLAEKDAFAFLRTYEGSSVLVVANRSSGAKTVSVTVPELDGKKLSDELGGKGAAVSGGKASVDLPPRGVAVLVAE